MNSLPDLTGEQSLRNYPVPSSASQAPSAQVRGYLPEFEESVDLRDYLDVIFRRKWIIMAFMVCVLVTALLVTLSIKPVYRAEGGIEFSINAPKVTKFEDVQASQPETREFMQTQVELLKSNSLAQRVIRKLDLDKRLIASQGEGKNQSGNGGLLHHLKLVAKEWLQGAGKGRKKAEDPERMELMKERQTEAAFSKKLEIQPQRNTTLVNIAFSHTDPAITRDVVNTLIQEFISWRMDSKIEAASTAKKQLDKQVQLARVQLEKSEENLNEFARKAGIVSLDPSYNAVYKQLEETNKALAEARTKRIEKEAAYEETLEGSFDSLPQVVDSKLIQELRKSYIDLLGQYKEMSATFKDDFPKQASLKARMKDVQTKISDEEARIAEAVKKDYQTSLKEEQELDQDSNDKKALALNLNDQATQYKILEREVQTNKQIHQSLLERFKEIDATVGTDMTNIRIVDNAELPLAPFKPNLRLNLILAMAVGLMGGIGLAFLLEFMDNTVKRIDEISDRFRISLLGVLPLVSSEESRQLDYLVSQKPRASFSEAVRTTKVSIQLSTPMGEPPQKLLFTSTTPGEGKSTTACNIAQAFAASEEKVIVLDCDLRKPRLHRVFPSKGAGRRGLSQFLSGMCSASDVIEKTNVENLDFICAGPIPPNPAELLASSRMKQLLGALSEQYDRILIDGPPAAGFADVLVLGNQVDGVVLVSTLGQTHREALRILRKSIHNIQACLLGCVVNKYSVGYLHGNYYSYSYKSYGENADQLLANASEN